MLEMSDCLSGEDSALICSTSSDLQRNLFIPSVFSLILSRCPLSLFPFSQFSLSLFFIHNSSFSASLCLVSSLSD